MYYKITFTDNKENQSSYLMELPYGQRLNFEMNDDDKSALVEKIAKHKYVKLLSHLKRNSLELRNDRRNS